MAGENRYITILLNGRFYMRGEENSSRGKESTALKQYTKAERYSGNPITPNEVAEARRRTCIDTLFALRMGTIDSAGNQVKKTVVAFVKAKYPHLCLFDDGTVVPWWKLALYYRQPGQRILEV